jgi:hypothetical protein
VQWKAASERIQLGVRNECDQAAGQGTAAAASREAALRPPLPHQRRSVLLVVWCQSTDSCVGGNTPPTTVLAAASRALARQQQQHPDMLLDIAAGMADPEALGAPGPPAVSESSLEPEPGVCGWDRNSDCNCYENQLFDYHGKASAADLDLLQEEVVHERKLRQQLDLKLKVVLLLLESLAICMVTSPFAADCSIMLLPVMQASATHFKVNSTVV